MPETCTVDLEEFMVRRAAGDSGNGPASPRDRCRQVARSADGQASGVRSRGVLFPAPVLVPAEDATAGPRRSRPRFASAGALYPVGGFGEDGTSSGRDPAALVN